MTPRTPGGPARRGRRALRAPWDRRVAVASCGGLLALSFLLPSSPYFDPWGWLIWGREVTALDLDTTSGPSWKPLPVAITALLSPAGELAPDLWLVVARAGWLAAMALAFVLAARLAGVWAGALACLALMLTPDVEARWFRYFLQGDSEALLVALCLGAVLRHLDGRHGHAFVVGALAALLRPEVWPFLGLYALWLWTSGRAPRALVAAVLAAVALAWFGGDWLGSGSPATGAENARVIGAGAARASLAWNAASSLVTLPVWLAAATCVAVAVRRGDRIVVGLGCGALIWMALVAAMTVLLGFAALGRFMAPAAAVVCVLAGVGAVRAVHAVGERASTARLVPRRPRLLRTGVAALLLAVVAPLALPRAEQVGARLDEAVARDRLEHQLDLALREAGGSEAVLRCGGLSADQAGLAITARPALAWKLGIRISDVPRFLGPAPGVIFARVGGTRARALGAQARALGSQPPALSLALRRDVRRLARTEEWAVFSLDCASHRGSTTIR